MVQHSSGVHPPGEPHYQGFSYGGILRSFSLSLPLRRASPQESGEKALSPPQILRHTTREIRVQLGAYTTVQCYLSRPKNSVHQGFFLNFWFPSLFLAQVDQNEWLNLLP